MTPLEIQLAAHYYLKIILGSDPALYGGVHPDMVTLEWYHPTIPAPSIVFLATLLPAALEWADQREERIRKKAVEQAAQVDTNNLAYTTALSMNFVVRELSAVDIRGSAVFFGDAVASRIGRCRLRLVPTPGQLGSEYEIDSEGKIAIFFSEIVRLQPDTYQLQLQFRSSNADYNVHLKNMHLAAYLLCD